MQRPAETLAAHHAWLRRVARRITKSPASADDLVQDTCVTALRSAPEDAEMRPWLRSVMRKLAWGHSRTESRRARREELAYLFTPPSAEPDPLLAYGVDRRRLTRALEALPEPFRSTIVQRYIEGRSCVEIARDEKVPASTVRTRQARGLELLRSELEGPQRHGRPARRARIAWLLPALGIERAAVAVSRRLVALSGHIKLGGLVAAGLAAALGFHLLDTDARDPQARPDAALPAATGAPAQDGTSGSWSHLQRAERERLARQLAEHRARSRADAPSYLIDLASAGHAGDDETPGRRGRGHDIDIDGDPAARLLEDCWRDERDELRCHKPSMTPNLPGPPTCDFLNRNLAFIDVTRSTTLMNISYANRFLTAALLTNMTLATNMGCQLYFDDMDGARRGQGPNGDDATSCVTKEGANGGLCTTCLDDSGDQTIMCAPADCYSEALPDGSLCTTCADPAGNSQTVCEDPEPADPGSCYSVVEGWRYICTSCENWPYSKCLAAQCSTDGAGCYTCVDEAGHSVSECPGYDGCHGHGWDITGVDEWNACNTSTCPDGTMTKSCHYAGLGSCIMSRVRGQLCIDCIDSAFGGCVDDGEPPLDPTVAQPANRPPPGRCITESSPGGFVSCTTCTNEDGDVDVDCTYAAGASCTAETPKRPWGQFGPGCSSCTYPDGTTYRVCM
jgi:RNA polymerase sigma-70 factor (ECF subfamily)